MKEKRRGGLVEACVASQDKDAIAAWKTFIEKNILPTSRQVTKDDIKAAKPIWLNQRDTRPRTSQVESLLTLMRVNPEALKDREIIITAYDAINPGRAAQRTFQSQNRQLGLKGLDYYENWKLGPGITIVDFSYYTHGSRPQFGGFYRSLQDNPVAPTTNGNSILLAVKQPNVLGAKLPQGDKIKLAEIVRKIMPADPNGTDVEMSLYDFACRAHEKGLL